MILCVYGHIYLYIYIYIYIHTFIIGLSGSLFVSFLLVHVCPFSRHIKKEIYKQWHLLVLKPFANTAAIRVSFSQQRVDTARVASAHIATGDELAHAVYPAA